MSYELIPAIERKACDNPKVTINPCDCFICEEIRGISIELTFNGFEYVEVNYA